MLEGLTARDTYGFGPPGAIDSGGTGKRGGWEVDCAVGPILAGERQEETLSQL
jgi:hypothetical protein